MKRKKCGITAFLIILVLFSLVLELGLIKTVVAPTEPLINYPPANFGHTFLPNTIYPIQAAWNPDKDGDGIIDIVAGKPTLVLVNMPNLAAGTYLTLERKVPIAGNLLESITGVVLSNGLAAFSMEVYTPGDYTLSILNQAAVTPVTISVKETRDLILYWGHMKDTQDYDVPTQTQFEDFIDVSSNFIESVYPVENVFDSFDPNEGNLGYNNVEVKDQKTMMKDCMKVAKDALSAGYEVGVSVVNQSYFSVYREKEGAIGVSWGPAVKGVIAAYNYPTAPAHEVAHTFGVYWGGLENYEVYPLYGAEASGVSVSAEEWRIGYDFMGVGFEGTTDNTWVNSDGTYNVLFDELTDPQVDPELVIVNGIFSNTGEPFEIAFPWSTVPNGTASVVPPGDYVIRFVDESNNQIGENVSFAVSYFMSINQGVAVGEVPAVSADVGTIATDKAPFCFAVAAPSEEYDAIQLIDNSDPANPQVIETVDKDDLEPVGPVDVTWILVAIGAVLAAIIIWLIWLYTR